MMFCVTSIQRNWYLIANTRNWPQINEENGWRNGSRKWRILHLNKFRPLFTFDMITIICQKKWKKNTWNFDFCEWFWSVCWEACKNNRFNFKSKSVSMWILKKKNLSANTSVWACFSRGSTKIFWKSYEQLNTITFFLQNWREKKTTIIRKWKWKLKMHVVFWIDYGLWTWIKTVVKVRKLVQPYADQARIIMVDNLRRPAGKWIWRCLSENYD